PTAPPELYTLSLHDALPISPPPGSAGSAASCLRGREHLNSARELGQLGAVPAQYHRGLDHDPLAAGDLEGEDLRVALPVELALSDRKSTRLNSSHLVISYAV